MPDSGQKNCITFFFLLSSNTQEIYHVH